MRIRPDITDSLLRREINFITKIKDGSKKIGEIHVNRANYRNFEANDTNWLKELFAKCWMRNLIAHLKQLDRFVVLTEEDKTAWTELNNAGAPQVLKIFETTKELGLVDVSPGTVIVDKHGLKIAGTDGFLNVKSLQLAGKKRMNIKDFLCGFKPSESIHCN